MNPDTKEATPTPRTETPSLSMKEEPFNYFLYGKEWRDGFLKGVIRVDIRILWLDGDTGFGRREYPINRFEN